MVIKKDFVFMETAPWSAGMAVIVTDRDEKTLTLTRENI
jgi:hypothetical protein